MLATIGLRVQPPILEELLCVRPKLHQRVLDCRFVGRTCTQYAELLKAHDDFVMAEHHLGRKPKCVERLCQEVRMGQHHTLLTTPALDDLRHCTVNGGGHHVREMSLGICSLAGWEDGGGHTSTMDNLAK